MILYLSETQILAMHEAIIRETGGSRGLRDRSGLEAAVARPAATFDGEDLYPSLAEKAAALMHSLAMNHPFVDGNKRVAVAAAEFFLQVNAYRLEATDEELEEITLALASSNLDKDQLTVWFKQRTVLIEPEAL